MHFRAPKDFPLADNRFEDAATCSRLHCNPSNVCSMRLTFKLLSNVCNYAFQQHYNQIWNGNVTKAFLGRYAVQKHLIDKIILHSSNKQRLDKARTQKAHFPLVPHIQDNYETEMGKYKKKPGNYQMPELPAVWKSNSIQLRDMPSAISHHLFLGITKAMFEDIIRNSNEKKKNQ